MTTELRGLKNVKTMGGRADRNRVRTAAEALMELSVLANEKQRLQQEQARGQRRHNDIVSRISEIGEKESRLHAFVKDPPPPVCQVRPAANSGPQLQATEFRY